jgi:hypothetical protein
MTTPLTPPEHAHNALVETAAQWLADQAQPPRPIIPTLKSRFGLSAVECCEAAALADKYRMLRRAFG